MKDLMKRFSEPSSYTAMAVVLYAFFPDFDVAFLKEGLTSMLAVVGFLMKEKGA